MYAPPLAFPLDENPERFDSPSKRHAAVALQSGSSQVMKLGVYKCPVCSGPLARWVIHSEFTCHHCHWAISANLAATRKLALLVALAAEAFLFGAIWLLADSFWSSAGMYLEVACFFGAFAWFVVMDLALRLTPLRPQSTQ